MFLGWLIASSLTLYVMTPPTLNFSAVHQAVFGRPAFPAPVTPSPSPLPLPWADTAIIFDGFSYGAVAPPLIPGLLVAPPPVPTFDTAELVFVEQPCPSTATAIDLCTIVVIYCIICCLVRKLVCCVPKFEEIADAEEEEEEELGIGNGLSHEILSIISVVALMTCLRGYAASICPLGRAQLAYFIAYEDHCNVQSRALTATINTHTAIKAEHSQLVHKLNRRLFRTRNRLERMSDCSVIFRIGMNDKTCELKGTQQTLDSTRQTLSSTQQTLASTQQELASTQQTLASVEQSLTLAHQQKRDSDEQFTAQLKDAHAYSTALESENKTLQTTVHTTRKDLQSSNEHAVCIRGTATRLRWKHFILLAIILVRNNELALVKKSCMARDAKIQCLQMEQAQRDAQYVQEKDTLTATIHGLGASLHAVTVAHESLTKSHRDLVASNSSLVLTNKEQSSSIAVAAAAIVDLDDSFTAARLEGKENLDLALKCIDQAQIDAAAAFAAAERVHAAEVTALQTEVTTLQTENAALVQKNANILQRDMQTWQEIAGLRLDLQDLEAARDAANSQSAKLRAKVLDLELSQTAGSYTPMPESDSTASLMALVPPSSDDLLALQLPLSSSMTSIDGFAPLANESVQSPDPFDSDTMLAIPNIRLTASAPSSPAHKFASTRHADWNSLQPSTSVPIDMDLLH